MQNHNQIFFSKKNKRKTQTNKKQKSKMFCMKDVSAQYVHYKNEKLRKLSINRFWRCSVQIK